MKHLKILGAAFIAVLSLGALFVTSASATLWLSSGASLSAETVGHSQGLVVLLHKGGLSGEFSAHCTGEFHGLFGPQALDLISEVLGLAGEKNLISCKWLKVSAACGGSVGGLVIVHALKLPWHTLLVLVGGVTEDRILSGTWQFLCSTGLTGECTGEAWAKFTKNGASGAEFAYEGKEPAATCTDGGEGHVTTGSGTSLGFTVS
jgi:hypothetical protein